MKSDNEENYSGRIALDHKATSQAQYSGHLYLKVTIQRKHNIGKKLNWHKAVNHWVGLYQKVEWRRKIKEAKIQVDLKWDN